MLTKQERQLVIIIEEYFLAQVTTITLASLRIPSGICCPLTFVGKRNEDQDGVLVTRNSSLIEWGSHAQLT